MWSIVVCVVACSAIIWLVRYWMNRPVQHVDTWNELLSKMPEKTESAPQMSSTEQAEEIVKKNEPPTPFLEEKKDSLLQQKGGRVGTKDPVESGRETGRLNPVLLMDTIDYLAQQKRRNALLD